MEGGSPFLARARCDAADMLVHAEEPLIGMQLRCGGELPGRLAVPGLLELVRKARQYGLRLARPFEAQDGDELVKAWVEITPDAQTGECVIAIASWQSNPIPPEDLARTAINKADIERALAEFSARLDPHQKVLAAQAKAPDLEDLLDRMLRGIGRPWTDFIKIEGSSHRQPLHWRLLDGAKVTFNGTQRQWKANLQPLGAPEPGSAGFELLLIADTPLPEPERPKAADAAGDRKGQLHSVALGREVAPVLRQPIARIIANAETIRSRLAGPLSDEYSNYAADIAMAGQHLLSLLEDLGDLEVVESAEFNPAPDQIDLADVARRAVGILGVRAQERGIRIDAPARDETLPAIGEFRRVLQVMLNLLGNAIRYTPEGSQVWIRLDREGDRAGIIVADQGRGLSEEEQARIFNKFERLGRSGDGGSGLGLYISRKLARAMGGDLTVDSAPGSGARFKLEIPADLSISPQ